jgi:enoyl-CoA hydratase/carnithine racemase
VQRLTRHIGRKKAVEMIVTGEPIAAQEALDAGLINYVVPADQLMKKAEAIALKITEASPTAVSSSLQLLNESSRFASTDDAVTFSHTVFDNVLNSDDFYEGSTAFAQKRKPRWIGK